MIKIVLILPILSSVQLEVSPRPFLEEVNLVVGVLFNDFGYYCDCEWEKFATFLTPTATH